MKQDKSVLLIGLGSIGSVLFSRLVRKNYKVVCVTSNDSAKLFRRKGARVQLTTDISPQLHNCEVYTEIPEKYTFSKCIIATKSWLNQVLVADLEKWLTPEASIILFQNGLNIEKPFLKHENKWKLTRVVTSLAALRKEKNHAIEASIGDTVIGKINYEEEGEINRIREMLTEIGLSVEISENIHRNIWLKTITNSTIGPLSAITGLLNGDVLKDSFLNGIVKILINEILEVAPEELSLNYEDAYKLIERIVGQTAEHKSSMLQDIERKAKTEIDTLNGELSKIAESKEIEVPINIKLVELIKRISAEDLPKELAVLELRSIY